MPVWQAIVLAVVQGLTEFLPISSTAHLVLVPWFFGWQDPGLTFDVALHVGTLIAVLAYFSRTWTELTLSGRGTGLGGVIAPSKHTARRLRLCGFWTAACPQTATPASTDRR